MKKYVISVLIAFILAGLIFASGCGSSNQSSKDITQKTSPEKIICDGPPCLAQYFQSCTPAETTMSSEQQIVTITIHGFVNDDCHFTMVFGNVTAANCYFKKENLNVKVLGQIFGNKEGQEAVLAEACK